MVFNLFSQPLVRLIYFPSVDTAWWEGFFIERILIFLRLCFGRGCRGFSSIYGYLISFWLYCLKRAKEDPNTNEGELFRHPEDGNELQKEVFAALFSAPGKSDEFPEITVKTKCEVQSIRKGGEWTAGGIGTEYKANVVDLQQDNRNSTCSYINYIDWIC